MEKNKIFYETPLCEILPMNLESQMLQASPGEPGEELHLLDPLSF